jgi:hypothetical protein
MKYRQKRLVDAELVENLLNWFHNDKQFLPGWFWKLYDNGRILIGKYWIAKYTGIDKGMVGDYLICDCGNVSFCDSVSFNEIYEAVEEV